MKAETAGGEEDKTELPLEGPSDGWLGELDCHSMSTICSEWAHSRLYAAFNA
jgi:hypothetical protein